MLPHTFSLRRLMLGVTILCVLCGIAFYLPEKGLTGWLALLFVAPPGILILCFIAFDPEPWAMFFVTLLGAMTGFLLFPILFVVAVVTLSEIRWTSEYANFTFFILLPAGSTLGVLLAGFTYHFLRRRNWSPPK